jgi:hypothetical protein
LAIYDELREKFVDLIKKNGFESEEVTVKAKPLTTEEAIGNPEDRDYPLITGRERMMQAEFRGTIGQAYTDMYGDYSGSLFRIATMDLKNNFRRAIFVTSLNAVLRYLGVIDKTIHCKDDEPRECSLKLAEYIKEKFGSPKIAMVGLQPRMVETLSRNFDLRVTDMDQDNIDTQKFGVTIQSPDKITDNLDWCDVVVATGSTLVNDTIGGFFIGKPVLFYGITISGAAALMGWDYFCYCGK